MGINGVNVGFAHVINHPQKSHFLLGGAAKYPQMIKWLQKNMNFGTNKYIQT